MTLAERLKREIQIAPNFPQKGISFKDITPIFHDPSLTREVANAIALPFKNLGITKVAGIESRGFLLGALIAQELNAGFVIIRKQGKLPGKTQSVTYQLEYGAATIEIQTESITANDKILIHDDLLATGGTAAAAYQLIQALGAKVLGFGFIINLCYLPGEKLLKPLNSIIHSVISYEE